VVGETSLRKLAREAVIFCLLGSLLAIVGSFVVLDRGEREAVAVAKSAVHAEVKLDLSASEPIPPNAIVAQEWKMNFVKVPLTNGMTLSVRPCLDVDISAGLVKPNGDVDVAVQQAYKQGEEEKHDCRYFVDDPYAKYGGHLDSVPLGDPNQVTIERDYWAAYKVAKRGAVLRSLMVSGWLGLYGFPAGLGVWCLYRLVRFAIFG
jgi:hypothetical protein